MKKKISITVNEKLLNGIDGIVDGLKIRNRSQAIEYLMNKFFSDKKTAIVLANGLTTRVNKNDWFRVLGKIKGEPIIKHIVTELKKYNFRNIFIIGEKNLNLRIFKILGGGSVLGVNISYIDEKETEGDNERLKLLKGKIKNTFLVVPGENLFDINLDEFFKFHALNGGMVTLALTSYYYNPTKSLGNVKIDGIRIAEFYEKPSKVKSNVVSSGIFIAEPDLLEYPGKWLSYDVFPKLAKNNLLLGFMFSGYWFDINSKKDFNKAKNFF